VLSLPCVEPSYFHGSVSRIACSPDKPTGNGGGEWEVDGVPGVKRSVCFPCVRLCFDEENQWGEMVIHELETISKWKSKQLGA